MKKLSLLVLIFILAVPTILSAQEEAADEEGYAANGAFIQIIETGTFTEAEDMEETYILTIEDNAANMQWVLTGNAVAAGQYAARDFSDDWAFALAAMDDEDFSVEAILTTDDAAITLDISNPVFGEDGTFTYTVTVIAIDIFAEANDDKAELPESFENGALFIPLYPDVAEVLVGGRNERVSSTRDTDVQPVCDPANFPSC